MVNFQFSILNFQFNQGWSPLIDIAKVLQMFFALDFIVFYCILLYFMVLQVAEYVYGKVCFDYLRCGSDLSAIRRQFICYAALEHMR